MIGRKSIGFVDDDILIVFGQFPISTDVIVCLDVIEMVAFGFEADDIRLAFFD